MLTRVAERSSHAAAAGIEVHHRRPRYPAEQGLRRREAAHCFLVAVAVEEHLRGPGGEVELHPPRFAFALEELFEQYRLVCDLQRPALRVVAQQRGDIFFDRRQAAGLQEHDRHAALGERIQPVHAGGRLAPGGRQQTLRNQRPPAARERCELDVEPGDLEDLQSRHSDIRSVVVGERIVEERGGGGEPARRRCS